MKDQVLNSVSESGIRTTYLEIQPYVRTYPTLIATKMRCDFMYPGIRGNPKRPSTRLRLIVFLIPDKFMSIL